MTTKSQINLDFGIDIKLNLIYYIENKEVNFGEQFSNQSYCGKSKCRNDAKRCGKSPKGKQADNS